MKRVRSGNVRIRFLGVVLRRPSFISLAVISVAAASSAWGQSSWPNYPNSTAITVTSGGNVGIGTTDPNTLVSHR